MTKIFFFVFWTLTLLNLAHAENYICEDTSANADKRNNVVRVEVASDRQSAALKFYEERKFEGKLILDSVLKLITTTPSGALIFEGDASTGELACPPNECDLSMTVTQFILSDIAVPKVLDFESAYECMITE